MALPSECLLTASLTNMLGIAPEYGVARLIITNAATRYYPGYVLIQGSSSAYCDYSGTISVNVIESSSLSFRYFFQIQYTDVGGLQQLGDLGWATIPDQDTVDLSTLTFYPTADALNPEI